MQKEVIWYYLHLKTISKSVGLYIQMFGIIALLLIAKNINIPDGKNVRAGLCVGESRIAASAKERLLSEENVFKYISYSSPEELKADVKAGRIECGFIFADDFDAAFEKGSLTKEVEYICSPDTTKGYVMQEDVYAAIYKNYSEVILKQGDSKIYGDNDEKRTDELLEKNIQYLDSDNSLFRTEMIKVKTIEEKEAAKGTWPIGGLAYFFTFIVMYLYAGNQSNTRVKAVQNKRDRFVFDLVGQLAAGTVPLVVMNFILLCMHEIVSVKIIGLSILFWIYSAIWIALVIRIIRSKNAYYASVLVIAIMFLLLCPVFIDLAEYVPAVSYIRLLIPLNLPLV